MGGANQTPCNRGYFFFRPLRRERFERLRARKFPDRKSFTMNDTATLPPPLASNAENGAEIREGETAATRTPTNRDAAAVTQPGPVTPAASQKNSAVKPKPVPHDAPERVTQAGAIRIENEETLRAVPIYYEARGQWYCGCLLY